MANKQPVKQPLAVEANPAAQRLTLDQALQLAARHQEAGELQPAEGLLRQILRNQPKNAPALHLLGIIAHQAGKTEDAIHLISQAIEIQPSVGQFHSNLGEMCRLLKRLDEAVRHGEQAVRMDPNSANVHSNLGIAYYDQKQMDKAEACQKRALAINPTLVPALNNLGSIKRHHKDVAGAIDLYRQVLAVAPQHVESMNNLGAVLLEDEQPEEAVKMLLNAIRLSPIYAEAHCNIAGAFMVLEQLDKAEAGFRRSLALKGDSRDAYLGLAKLHQERNNLVEAEAMANKALAIDPGKPEAYALLGSLMTESGFPDKAEQSFSRALEIEPEFITAILGKGHLQMERGDLTAAEASFLRALALEPDDLGARLSVTQVRTAKADDDNMAALVAEAADIDTMPETKAMPLHFALGKCYDDTKQYDLAFKHYLEGCRLKRKRINYSADDNDLLLKNIRETFTPKMIEQSSGGGCPSDLPIFVLGMPRSGTTLTEQIIASHPLVHGAGELPDLLQIASAPRPSGIDGYPLSVRGLMQAEFRIMGEKYVKGLRERNAEARHITDKMPANFNMLGLIHLITPNAKIVHVKRNPVDTCLSGFTRLFSRSQHQSYDLAELGRYYRNYAALMNHWREVLPAGAFYEVQYEELVDNIDEQARKLIAYCGLEWNDACLEFHKNERTIRTASVTQVRQPIYKSSVERWRKYEAHLGPLLDALGDLAPG